MVRYDWSVEEIADIYKQPFPDLIYQAQVVHRQYFTSHQVSRSTLLSIKTGGCSEDCAYCAQSVHHNTEIEIQPLLSTTVVAAKAQAARESGSTRLCMSAAWPEVRDEKQFEHVLECVRVVAAEGLEVCCTLGMLTPEQAQRLSEAGCDFYNHNLDTSPEYYSKIVTTRTFEERLRTLEHVRRAGIKICSGGIIGMGEEQHDRHELLRQLAICNPHPESVPINMLVRIPGTKLEDVPALDPLEYVRTVATTRIVMPQTAIRIAAGRTEMSDEMQALCFVAGATSIFSGERLLTTPNPPEDHDAVLLQRLGMEFSPAPER